MNLLRRHHLLAWVSALGLLLHAGMAAAQVYCAMAGGLFFSCCCPSDERPDGPVLRSADGCCRDALAAPDTDLHQGLQPLPPPASAAAWAQVIPPEPPALPSRSAIVPQAASPPLLALSSIVILR